MLSNLIGLVHDGKELVMVQRKEKPVAVVDNPETHELSEAERQELLRQAREATERIAELNKDEDPDEVERIIDEVVEEVRQEHYEREQRQAAGIGGE
jgi:PHD/YefM family antitoxin component YafN of YafNO toxin-antitoxin module